MIAKYFYGALAALVGLLAAFGAVQNWRAENLKQKAAEADEAAKRKKAEVGTKIAEKRAHVREKQRERARREDSTGKRDQMDNDW
jgi:uncharacterized membrane protein YccC